MHARTTNKATFVGYTPRDRVYCDVVFGFDSGLLQLSSSVFRTTMMKRSDSTLASLGLTSGVQTATTEIEGAGGDHEKRLGDFSCAKGQCNHL